MHFACVYFCYNYELLNASIYRVCVCVCCVCWCVILCKFKIYKIYCYILYCFYLDLLGSQISWKNKEGNNLSHLYFLCPLTIFYFGFSRCCFQSCLKSVFFRFRFCLYFLFLVWDQKIVKQVGLRVCGLGRNWEINYLRI